MKNPITIPSLLSLLVVLAWPGLASADPITGMVGVGTWGTQAEFKDIKVTKDGETLFASDFSNGMDGWQTRRGQWEVVDGALRQTGGEEDARALVGDPSWSDYTLTLKARKLGGNEGFLVLFGIPNTDSTAKSWWNLGGWANSAHALEIPDLPSERVNGRIENNRWYDVKVELQGGTVRAYLDGQLVHTATMPPEVPPFAVRPGYRVDLMAKDVGEVRFIEFGPPGDLYVSQPRTGAIITLRESGGRWRKVADFVTDKETVHGMHYFDGWLWFTQSGAVWKARDTNGDGKADQEVQVLADLPSGGGHWWRSILVTPDGFYTSIGDSGNITDEPETDRQKIWHYNLDGTGKKLFVSGIRNTEKLRLRPGTQEVFGADHGSDNYGAPLGERGGNQPFTDRIPPCEFNHYVDGGFYGHPFIVGNRLPRLEFRDRPNLLELARTTISPAWCFGAHWAPNGWNFIHGDAMQMKGDAVVACHGSWNSSVRVGYRLERLIFDPVTGEVMGSQRLVSMLTENGNVLGRPCDVAEAPDGSIYFSDDARGRIYRLTVGVMPETAPEGAAIATLPDAVITDPFRPLELFQSRCASCHGSYGLNFGPQFKGKLSEDELREKTEDMVAGPAQVHLDEAQSDALLNFLRSLSDDVPYGLIAEHSADGWLSGEASPDASVTLSVGNQTETVPLEGHRWRVKLPDGTKPSEASIHVARNGKETVLKATPDDQ